MYNKRIHFFLNRKPKITMNISKISYSKIYATSQFLNERIGVEVDINEGEDAKVALQTAKSLADEFHKEANPELYKFNEKSLTAEEANIVTEISNCTTMDKLATYKGFATGVLSKYYIDKMKELTKKK